MWWQWGGKSKSKSLVHKRLNPTSREGNGTPLQYSCLENPTDRGAWWVAVQGVAKSRTRLKDFTFHFSLSCIGEGNGNPLQCSCLENPRDGGAWWAAIYGIAQSWTRLKRLSTSNSSSRTLLQGLWGYDQSFEPAAECETNPLQEIPHIDCSQCGWRWLGLCLYNGRHYVCFGFSMNSQSIQMCLFHASG